MSDSPSLELTSGQNQHHDDADEAVPPPLPPDDPEAWYAPTVRAQYELRPDVVATVRETDDAFAYDVREPHLSTADWHAVERIHDHFDGANLRRPRTREGTAERIADGFAEKYRRALERLTDETPTARRRVSYYALRNLCCLGDLTPLALDDSIEVADTAGERLVVHTEDYAPATTDLSADPEYIERFVSERIDTYSVPFRGFDVPVVLYRERLLGNDAFAVKYAVLEPDLLPGDEALVEECKERIWEANVDEVIAPGSGGDDGDPREAFIRDRSANFLSRKLTAHNTREWLDAAEYRVRSALSEYGFGVPPVDGRYADDRLSDLVYYVLRDYVGHGKLTIPIRDPHLEDVEANRVGERVKVVPRTGVDHDGRVPTNLVFEDEREFVNVVTQIAAADGTELNASNPSAKVNVRPEGVDDDVTIRCAVALPVISEDGPHVSIRKQAPDAMTPVDLINRGSLSTELVALLWQLYEHHCVVLFSGPTGVGKTTLMNAHMPFISFEDRPISIDEGSREVRLPHETGVSLTTRDHESDFKQVSMADLMTECNYLNPDVEVIAEINTPESFRTFAETLNTGHGVIGTTHAEDIEKLVNRVVEQGLPPYLLAEIDLVVFPKHVDGDRYAGRVVEFLSEREYQRLDDSRRTDDDSGTIEKGGTTICWNTVARRESDGTFNFGYTHPDMPGGSETRRNDVRVFHRLADRTDRSVEAVEAEFHRKHGYVQYLEHEGVRDFDALFDFLADLETNEAATVERATSSRRPAGTPTSDPTVPSSQERPDSGGYPEESMNR
ncbi:type II/IV secretion system ATPase subunit [Halostella pelagica]|uniref:type II/IV secretion system ATPase subunit n=1 Tax=Halostella pelagica TaxID=2583824 RepID=UPI00108104D4|nr:type II/IV secretion system ATPase subunit [Halostella pelagica]